MEEGKVAYLEGDYSKAIDAFTRAIYSPEVADAPSLLAKALANRFFCT